MINKKFGKKNCMYLFYILQCYKHLNNNKPLVMDLIHIFDIHELFFSS